MEECVQSTWMPPLPAKVNRGITPARGKAPKIKLGLPFIVLDLVYTIQMICVW